MSVKRKTLDKNFKDLKFKKLAKKQKLQERGITLIALVVTIIILLILSGVTLNIALSDNGLFSKTKKATEDYKEAQSDEEDAIRQISTQMYSEYVGATVKGYTPSGGDGSCTVGKETTGGEAQTINREPLNWRVWDFDGKTLRIIGDPTTQTLTLNGAAGYNNGVWALDHICKELYSNNKKGVSVTNLKRTDIQKVSTYDYTKFKHKGNSWQEDTTSSDDENLIYFGETKTYPENNQYPKMWDDNDKEWKYEYNKKEKTATGGDEECKKWEAIGTEDGQMTGTMNQGNKNTIFKQSNYTHSYEESEFVDNTYNDLIFKKSDEQPAVTYWLTGRFVILYDSACAFGLQYVNPGTKSVSGRGLCNSDRYYG